MASPREMILGGLVLFALVAVFGGLFLFMSARSEDRAMRTAFEERLGAAPMEFLGTYGRSSSPCQWHAARLLNAPSAPPVLGHIASRLTDWSQTPIALTDDRLGRCANSWSETETGATLRASLDRPGAFVASQVFDSGGRQTAIYAPATGFLILIRTSAGG